MRRCEICVHGKFREWLANYLAKTLSYLRRKLILSFREVLGFRVIKTLQPISVLTITCSFSKNGNMCVVLGFPIGMADQHVSVMVAVDAATTENGCLQVAPGKP